MDKRERKSLEVGVAESHAKAKMKHQLRLVCLGAMDGKRYGIDAHWLALNTLFAFSMA
jgi:hypothetical protein